MELKTKEIGKIFELDGNDCSVIRWTRNVQLDVIKFDDTGEDYEVVDDKTFKEGEKTLVKNLCEFCKESVELDFMDGTSCLHVLKNSFEVPLCLKGEKEGDIIHNNVPEWVR